MISGVPEPRRSTHTNYLINLLKSAAATTSVQQRGQHYTDPLGFVKSMLQLRCTHFRPDPPTHPLDGRRALYAAV